jgi:hypothetical protein
MPGVLPAAFRNRVGWVGVVGQGDPAGGVGFFHRDRGGAPGGGHGGGGVADDLVEQPV